MLTLQWRIHGTIQVPKICGCSRLTNPMLGFKSFQSAKNILSGIELMHMIRKGQMMMEEADKMSYAEQFYALSE